MFEVYRNPSATGPADIYALLQDALAALNSNYSIVFAPDFQLATPIPISQFNVTAHLSGNPLSFSLDLGATLFRLGGVGSATVHTGAADSRVYANASDTTVFGNVARDFLHGDAGNDRLFGGAGDDVLYGGDGNDTLFMGAGRDRAYGDAGNDILIGGGDRNQYTGGAGADTFIVNKAPGLISQVWDFSAAEGDRIVFAGFEGISDYQSFLSLANLKQSRDDVVIRIGDTNIRIANTALATLNAQDFGFDAAPFMPKFGTFAEFAESGLAEHVHEITIGDVVYKMRAGEPPHQDYKFADAAGNWWSPDYFVVVVGGQSNMLGAGGGGDLTIDPNVMAFDWVHGQVIAADYALPPAGGEGVRTGTTIRNNLYYPFANEVSAELDRPVLVVAQPVSGSRISTWLASGTGENWAALSGNVDAALAAVHQDSVDAFLWHQGEGDYPIPTADYAALVLELAQQVRDMPWGNESLPVLIGELSREGVNSAQNAALQLLETTTHDPYLGFVSSAGLESFDVPGVHFDGASLVEFGGRYADMLLAMLDNGGYTPPPNTAPTVAGDAAIPAAITMDEGQEFRLDLSQYFADAEGDTLYYYAGLDDRRQYFATTDQNSDELILTPGYGSAGSYILRLYANDYALDGDAVSIALTVRDNAPHVTAYTGRDFTTELAQYRDLDAAQAALSQNRGVDILDASALSHNGYNLVTLDSLHIRGGDGLTGEFALADGVLRSYLYGLADFDVRGNDLNNYIVGSDGDNRLWGGTGADRLYGGAGSDQLFGDAGNDSLYGGDDADYLTGGDGNDNAWGGAGADHFILNRGDDYLYARDFNWAEGDTVTLSGYQSFTDYVSFRSSATFFDSGARLVIDLEGDRLLLENLSVATVNDSMFMFA